MAAKRKGAPRHGDRPNLNTPATLAEVIQIATAAAGDALVEYSKNINQVVIQQTILLSTLQEILISKGVITQEDYDKVVEKQTKSYQEERKKYIDSLVAKGKTPDTEEVDELDESETLDEILAGEVDEDE